MHRNNAPLWNFKDRKNQTDRARETEFDLLIIGGGITGAGVAREAALRGLSFFLIDKADFASGTSSRSSKLAHGGLRYLATGELGLVRLSTTERNWLRTHLPNLVRPAPFITNVFRKTKDTRGRLKLGMFLYHALSDWFSLYKNFKKHVFIKPGRMKQMEPNLLQDGLEFSALYYDANVDDARLTVETIKEALEISDGKSVALNYVRAADFMQDLNGKIYGAIVKNELNGQRFSVRAKAVVNAAGVWADEVLKHAGAVKNIVRPTKGSHIVVPADRLGNKNSIGLRSVDDGRYYFILKRDEVCVIGTTDTDYQGNPDDPVCTRADCDYLLHTVNRLFPAARLTDSDIISAYAGIRPLVLEEGKKESAVSRKHVVMENTKGLVTVIGGKLTEFRRMAEDTLLTLEKKKYISRFRGKMSGKGFSKKPYRTGITMEDFNKTLMREKLSENASYEQLKYLHQQYGKNAFTILRKIKSRPVSARPLLAGHHFCRAEIEYIMENENITGLSDLMMRRTEMQMLVPHEKQKELAHQVMEILKPFLELNEIRSKEEISRYLNWVQKSVAFLRKPVTGSHPYPFRTRKDSRGSGPAAPRPSRQGAHGGNKTT